METNVGPYPCPDWARGFCMTIREQHFLEFKAALIRFMSVAMNRNSLFFASALILLGLAACGKNDDNASGAKETTVQVTEPAAPAAGDGNGPDLVTTLREKAGVMSAAEKAAAIESARANARAAALAVGQSAEQAENAAMAAANAAERALSN